jgi:Holliday junction resolvasome RuvABC endonuclease subunit
VSACEEEDNVTRTPVQLAAAYAVVGIDPSLTATGVCGVIDGMERVTQLLRTLPDQHRPARLLQQRDALHSFLVATRGQLGPTGQLIVAMETEIWMGNPTQSGDASAIQAVYQMLLWTMDPQHQWLHYLPVNVAHVKKWLGAKQKNEVLLQVYKRYKREFRDDNEADAFTLGMIGDAFWHYNYSTKGVAGATWPELTQPQLEVLDKLLKAGYPWEQAEPVRRRHAQGRKKKLPTV